MQYKNQINENNEPFERELFQVISFKQNRKMNDIELAQKGSNLCLIIMSEPLFRLNDGFAHLHLPK